MLTGFLLVTVVFGLTVVAMTLRICRAVRQVRAGEISGARRLLSQLDVIFSGIVLAGFLIFYSVFIVNFGH